MAANLEFFFDPVCPWAWITSCWVREVQALRRYDVEWRFISLKFVNEDKMDYSTMPAGLKEAHVAGTQALRVAARARQEGGNAAVGGVYEALGLSFHNRQERDAMLADPAGHLASVLTGAGLDPAWAGSWADEGHDGVIRAETELALERTGKDVGTPIITFSPGTPREASFFGPVVASIPRGDQALALWDAVETIATTSGMAELKRSLRSRPSFD